MMSYLILFAFVGLILYYGYGIFKTIKNFIISKRTKKDITTETDYAVQNVSDEEEQTHDD